MLIMDTSDYAILEELMSNPRLVPTHDNFTIKPPQVFIKQIDVI